MEANKRKSNAGKKRREAALQKFKEKIARDDADDFQEHTLQENPVDENPHEDATVSMSIVQSQPQPESTNMEVVREPVANKRKKPSKVEKPVQRKKSKHDQLNSDEEEEEEEQVEVVFRQRIPPGQFIKNIIVGLPETHIQAIKDVGFDSFLKLDLDSAKSSFNRELVTSFNPDRSSFQLPKMEEIRVTKEDVHAVYALPIGERKIQDNKWVDDNEQSTKFLKTWRQQFQNGVPTNTALVSIIETQKDQDVNSLFIWNFIVAAINCCVRSTANKQLNFKFLYCCEDISQIKKFDWCAYTYENLISSVSEWKQGASYFTGPLPLMMIIYFDRLKRGTDESPRTIPLLSVWNKERIQERMKVEKKRGFGQGIVLNTLATTTTTNPPEETQQQHTKEQDSQEQPYSSSTEDVMGYILSQFNNIAKGLASHVQSMYKLVDKANNIIEEVNIPDDMRNVLRDVWSKYTMLQPHVSQPGSTKYTPCFMSQDETIFDEPAFLSELNDVMNKAWANFEGQAKEQSVPTHQTSITPTEHDVHPPPEQTEQETPHGAAQSNPALDIVPIISTPSFNLHLSSESVTPTSLAGEDIPTDTQVAAMTEEIVHKLTSEHCAGPVPGMQREKRIKQNLPIHLRSPFMLENEKISSKIDAQSRIIAEYAFSSGPLSEYLYQDGLNFITREDILSLQGDNLIFNNMIDSYGHILNIINKRRQPGAVNRFFFTTELWNILCGNEYYTQGEKLTQRYPTFKERLQQEMKHSQITTFDKMDLVFIPVCAYKHYYLFCYNFERKEMEIIDNRYLEKGVTMKAKYSHYPATMTKSFAKFLKEEKVGNGNAVSKFQPVIKNLPWRNNDNIHDCGVYAMKHMETYTGQNDGDWNIGIDPCDREVMKELRMEYCGKILTSQVNSLREELLNNARTWASTELKNVLQ